MRTLHPLSPLVLCAAVMAGCVDSPTSSEAIPHAQAVFSSAPQTVPITAMSRNLYLGADLSPLFAVADGSQIPFVVAELWGDVLANDFPARAAALADEIAATEPQLVGLQEVARYHLQAPGPTVVLLDYLAVLLGQLQARGLDYRVAAVVNNIQLQLPIFVPSAGLGSIEFLLRDVILARGDVRTADPAGANYQTVLELSAAGVPIVVPRGWTAVTATRGGTAVRFVNTHLEAFHPLVNGAQAQELAAILAGETGAVVLTGDINSGPGDPGNRPAYGILRQAGFDDAWLLANPGEAGFTCCFDDDLSQPAGVLDHRIDVVFFRQPAANSPGVDRASATLVGADPGDRVWSDAAGALLWPSDHAGLVATLLYRSPRPPSP